MLLFKAEGLQTPSRRPKQLEKDVPFHSVSTATIRSVEDIRRYFHETVWNLMMRHGDSTLYKKLVSYKEDRGRGIVA